MNLPRTRERIAVRVSSAPEASTTSARAKATSSNALFPLGQVTTARQAPRSGSTRASERAKSVGKRGSDEDAFTKVADFTRRAKITLQNPAPGRFQARTWVISVGP